MPDETPVTTEEVQAMTGEQFAWHIQHMLWGLNRLMTEVPRRVAAASAVCNNMGGGPVAESMRVLCHEQNADFYASYAAIQAVLDHAHRVTITTLGSDWYQVGVESRNAVAIASRLGNTDPAAAKSWYTTVADALHRGHAAIGADLDEQLIRATAEMNFWGRMLAIGLLPLTAFEVLLAGLALFAAGIARAVGAGVGAVGAGILSGLWKAVKPLIIPALVVGTGAVLYLHNKDKIHGFVRGKKASESTGRIRFRRLSA